MKSIFKGEIEWERGKEREGWDVWGISGILMNYWQFYGIFFDFFLVFSIFLKKWNIAQISEILYWIISFFDKVNFFVFLFDNCWNVLKYFLMKSYSVNKIKFFFLFCWKIEISIIQIYEFPKFLAKMWSKRTLQLIRNLQSVAVRSKGGGEW